MATRPTTPDFIVEQMRGAGTVSARKMFGEYALFLDGRMIGLICDDQLFIKPTAAGRAAAGPVEDAPPYKGAKPCLLIPGDLWEDASYLSALARATAAELPLPVKKPRKPG